MRRAQVGFPIPPALRVLVALSAAGFFAAAIRSVMLDAYWHSVLYGLFAVIGASLASPVSRLSRTVLEIGVAALGFEMLASTLVDEVGHAESSQLRASAHADLGCSSS